MLEIKIDGIGMCTNLANSTVEDERNKLNKSSTSTSNNTNSEYPLDLTLQKR